MVCPVVFPGGVALLHLVVGDGIRVTQFVSGMGRCTIHAYVYGHYGNILHHIPFTHGCPALRVSGRAYRACLCAHNVCMKGFRLI